MPAPAHITLALIALIVRTVAAQAGLSVGALQGPGRRGRDPVDRARQRAVFIARRLRPELSLNQIGRQLGGRDTTSIAGAYRAGERQFEGDAAEETAVWQVLEALGVWALPPLDPLARKRALIDREINLAATRLERLRARRAELAPAEASR